MSRHGFTPAMAGIIRIDLGEESPVAAVATDKVESRTGSYPFAWTDLRSLDGEVVVARMARVRVYCLGGVPDSLAACREEAMGKIGPPIDGYAREDMALFARLPLDGSLSGAMTAEVVVIDRVVFAEHGRYESLVSGDPYDESPCEPTRILVDGGGPGDDGPDAGPGEASPSEAPGP